MIRLLIILTAGFYCWSALGDGTSTATMSSQPSAGRIIGEQILEHPDWFKESFLDIAEDVAEAAAEDKHIMLFFYLNGCPYCNKMVEENFKQSTYTAFLQRHFEVIALNIRGDREVVFSDALSLTEKTLSQHLQVRYVPTILFLNLDNTPILQLNGYRSIAAFKHALDFVYERAYQHTTLSRYIENRVKQTVYTLREHPSFIATDDLSNLANKPLMVLFEDRTCDACATLHDGILALPETHSILDLFNVVRLNALSEHTLISPDGKPTTPKAFAEMLDITYRPGIVLFDQAQEILRIDGLQYRYHFQTLLRYVGERHYVQYPDFRNYMRSREQSILSSGQDIKIGQ